MTHTTRSGLNGISMLLFAAIAFGFAGGIRAEIWSDDTGKFKVDAKFVALKGDKVVLKKPDGLVVEVPLARLDKASQDQAKRLAAVATPAATTPAANAKGNTSPVTKAPATTPAPTKTPEPATDQAPDAYLRELIMASESQDYHKVWNALPEKYQSDVHDLIHTFAQNMDSKLWKQGTDVLKKAAKVLKDKQSFILGHPMAAAGGPALSKGLPPIADVLDATINSELTDLEKLKTFDVAKFAQGDGKRIGGKMKAAAEAGKEFQKLAAPPPGIGGTPADANPFAELQGAKASDVKVVVVKHTGNSAVIRFDIKSVQGKEDEWIRVSGKWLPKKMVDEWDSEMAKAKNWLTTEMKPNLEKQKVQFGFIVNIINPALDRLLAAQNQEAFNAVINELQQQFAGMMGAPGQPGN